jgi:hypothetical protein
MRKRRTTISCNQLSQIEPGYSFRVGGMGGDGSLGPKPAVTSGSACASPVQPIEGTCLAVDGAR